MMFLMSDNIDGIASIKALIDTGMLGQLTHRLYNLKKHSDRVEWACQVPGE